MCTVTFIPLGKNQFILTSNRDESQSRNTPDLVTSLVGGDEVSYPKDPVSGGSWIGIAKSGRVGCVLNGAFEKHHHAPPYSRSRGLVLLDFFNTSGITQFLENNTFEGVEPFTMILYEHDQLVEFRWDGIVKHTKQVSMDLPHIWSSCTLYDQAAREKRTGWFEKWKLKNQHPNTSDLLQFHQYGGESDPINGFVMNRDNKVQTLSITAIEKGLFQAVVYHQDLINNTIIQKSIDLSSNETIEAH